MLQPACKALGHNSRGLKTLLFDVLLRSACRYSKLFAVLLVIYVAEPLLSQVRPAEQAVYT